MRPPTLTSGISKLLVGSLLAAAFSGAAVAQWNVGVGGNPARDGLSPQIGPTSPAILWQGSTSAIVAQQAVIDADLLVVARITTFALPNGTVLVGHDLNTGNVRWTAQLPANFSNSWRSRVTGIRNGQVYATRAGNTNSEYLYALNPVNGQILWQSQALITESTTESVTFAPNGDIITTGVDALNNPALLRINWITGGTVWTLPRTCPTTGGCDAAVFGNRAYFSEAGAAGPVITAVDLTTGARLYSSSGLGGGFAQQVAPFVGPNGAVYVPRSQNNVATDALFCLQDTGSALVSTWSVPIGYIPFASHAVGPDGSVYTYTPTMAVIRLDPTTGATRSLSAPMPFDFPAQPRMAIDAQGKVFVTNGGFGSGRLFVFTPDLRPIWTVPIPNVNVGGPALGMNGTLVVCGTGTDVRAYRTACLGYWSMYGTPCPGTGTALATFAGSGCTAPGAFVTTTVAGAFPGAPALLAIGLGPGPIPVTATCSALVDPWTGILVPLTLGATGGISLPFSLPTGIPPSDLFAQVFYGDPGAPSQIAATNALQVHIE